MKLRIKTLLNDFECKFLNTIEKILITNSNFPFVYSTKYGLFSFPYAYHFIKKLRRKPTGKIPLANSRFRWEDNIKLVKE